MSTITVKYQLSKEARRRIAVETGDEPKAEQELVIDLAPLAPEQRAVLLDARDKWQSGPVALQKFSPVSYPTGDDRDPWYATARDMDAVLTTADEVLAALAVAVTEQETARFEQARLRVEANADTVRDARAYLATPETENQPGHLIFRPGLWPDAERYAEATALVEQVKIEYERRLKLAGELNKAEAEAKKAKADAEDAARMVWAIGYGSDQLRRGLEAGYSCSRLYVVERAAVEFPDYVVDYNDTAAWKTRATPSIEALDERDAVLAAHPDLDPEAVQIVWLTVSASDAVPHTR